jgi:hypothetical protein
MAKHPLADGENNLPKVLVIYCIDTKKYVLVPAENQILEHQVIKFGGGKKNGNI